MKNVTRIQDRLDHLDAARKLLAQEGAVATLSVRLGAEQRILRFGRHRLRWAVIHALGDILDTEEKELRGRYGDV